MPLETAPSPLIYISSSSVRTDTVTEAVTTLSHITSNIELSGGNTYDLQLLGKLQEYQREKGLHFLAHSYFPPPAEKFILNFSDTGKRTRDFIQNTILYITALKIPYYSIHAGFKKAFYFDGLMLFDSADAAFEPEGYEENIAWFRERFPGIKLALENLYPIEGEIESCYFMHVDEIVLLMEKHDGIYLLLDLGHLKISAQYLGFDCLDAVSLLFAKYADRILEIHLSENDASDDHHLTVTADSLQYMILKKYCDTICSKKINVTIESRNTSLPQLSGCYQLMNAVLSGVKQ